MTTNAMSAKSKKKKMPSKKGGKMPFDAAATFGGKKGKKKKAPGKK